jgi:hypothetical protein
MKDQTGTETNLVSASRLALSFHALFIVLTLVVPALVVLRVFVDWVPPRRNLRQNIKVPTMSWKEKFILGNKSQEHPPLTPLTPRTRNPTRGTRKHAKHRISHELEKGNIRAAWSMSTQMGILKSTERLSPAPTDEITGGLFKTDP